LSNGLVSVFSAADIKGALTAQTGLTATTGNVTCANIDISTDASLISRKIILSKDDTTQYVIETGSCTNDQVVAYTTAFSANPNIILTYVADPVTLDTNLYALAGNPRTNFTCHGEAGIAINWMAVGAK